MPVAPHTRQATLTDEQKRENRAAVHRAWRSHADDVRHSLVNGFYQGWDLHPAQLADALRARSTPSSSTASRRPRERLANFVDKAAQATLVGDVFDDAATGQGLLNYFLRALNSGAIEVSDLERTGLTHGGSGAALVREDPRRTSVTVGSGLRALDIAITTIRSVGCLVPLQQAALADHPDEGPGGEHDRDDRAQRDEHEQHDARRDEPGVASWSPACPHGMALEQRDVAEVGLPADVGDVAQHRDQADQRIDARVQHHARQDDQRHAHAEAGDEQHHGEGRRGQLADAGHEPDDSVQAEPDGQARHLERAVQEHGPPAQLARGAMALAACLNVDRASSRTIAYIH